VKKKIIFMILCLLMGSLLYSATTDYLHTSGTKILDAQNKEVWLTGINWFGFETSHKIFHGLWNRDLESVLDQVVGLGFNVLRVPLHLAAILDWKSTGGSLPGSIMIQGDINPYLSGKTTLQILDYTVNYCNSIGLKIIFDMHSLEPDGYTFPLWYNSTYSLNNLIDGWKFIANRYNNNDVVIGLDIKNEPHGAVGEGTNAAKWDDSTDPNNWKRAAEQIATAILGINPNLLIFVEGVQYYKSSAPNVYDKLGMEFPSWEDPTVHTTWWGGNLMGVANYPVNLGSNQNKLVYSPHDYGPSVWDQVWFDPAVFNQPNMQMVWTHYWYYILENNIAPLFIGEWGGKLDNPANVKWMGYLRDLIASKKINHTFWCLNENSSDTGGILTGGTWDGVDTEKLNFIKATLWQNAAGKFVGLDHEVALGPNGISLSQYLSGSTVAPTPTPTRTVTSISTTTPAAGIKGDANNNGTVDIVDALMTAQYFVGLTPLNFNAANADADCNGSVTIVDALIIAQYYVGLISKFC